MYLLCMPSFESLVDIGAIRERSKVLRGIWIPKTSVLVCLQQPVLLRLMSVTRHRSHDKIQIREIEERMMAFFPASQEEHFTVYSILRTLYSFDLFPQCSGYHICPNFYSLESSFKGQQRIVERILDSKLAFPDMSCAILSK